MELRIVQVGNHFFLVDFWSYDLVDVYRTDGLPVDWGFADEKRGAGLQVADEVCARQLCESRSDARWGRVASTVASVLTEVGL